MSVADGVSRITTSGTARARSDTKTWPAFAALSMRAATLTSMPT